jgi:hypothetical protein
MKASRLASPGEAFSKRVGATLPLPHPNTGKTVAMIKTSRHLDTRFLPENGDLPDFRAVGFID